MVLIKSDTSDEDDSMTSRSTTQEDTPPPSYLPSNNTPTSVSLSTSHISVNLESTRPATPIANTNTSSIIGRKRSLTLLSPQNISTQSTRELKRKPSDKIGK